MPNTNPTLTSRETIEDRIALGDKAVDRLAEQGKVFFHGLYAGVTADPEQIKKVVKLYYELFPRVVGLKGFAGPSTGDLHLINKKEQQLVLTTLAEVNYEGPYKLHCEKETLMKPELWDITDPISHTKVRHPDTEVKSAEDQIKFAQKAGFQGTLIIAHTSVPETLYLVERERENSDFKIACEVTPHHAMLNAEMMTKERGHTMKMNPPLRFAELQQEIYKLAKEGRFSYFGSDHAPHKLIKKQSDNPPSGIPGLPFNPVFIQHLYNDGMSEEMINDLTHNNILEIYNIHKSTIPNTYRILKVSQEEINALASEYEFDAFEVIR
jgi:dihydroorotase